MPLAPQTITLSLREGLDTKSDPKQVVPGRLLVLENGILTKLGSIQKRNGYSALAALPTTATRLLSTFKGQLFGSGGGSGYAFSPSQAAWASQGPCDALQISVSPVIHNSFQQTSQDAVVHPAGITVVAWEDSQTTNARYSVIDNVTGYPIVANVGIPETALRPKCAVLGSYVVIVYYGSATANHLRYIAIPVLSPGSPTAPADLATNVNAGQVFGAVSTGSRVYFAYANTLGTATQLSVKYLASTLGVSSELQVDTATLSPTAVDVFVDPVTSNVWLVWADGTNVKTTAVDGNVAGALFTTVNLEVAVGRHVTGIIPSGSTVASILYDIAGSPTYNTVSKIAKVNWLSAPPPLNSAVVSATGGTLAAGTYYYVVTALGLTGETLASNEMAATTTGTTSSVVLAWNTIPGATGYRIYRGTTPGGEGTFYAVGVVSTFTDTGAAGTAGTPPTTNTFVGYRAAETNAFRSIGLASKPWIVNGSTHWLAGYSSTLQSTYFLMTTAGVVGQLAPGVAGGITAKPVLPEVTQASPGVFTVSYLLAHEIGAQAGIILSQTGVSLAEFDYTAPQMGLELSDDLHVTGGMLYSFDGARLVEHNFLLYPENIAATPSGTGGTMLAGQYQYVAVFEWWDNFGLHQSGTSIPVTVTTAGSTSSVSLTIPTLRVTNRTSSISIALYRTAANGTVFYRITPPTNPLLNSTTADTVPYTDTVPDSSIIGNAQLYTTSGEMENQAAPAPGPICNYANRIMLVSSENPLNVWFSKQVVQGVPVEFSPSFQFTVDQRGGAVTAMAQLDDKLIIFKRRWIFGMVGDGPSANGVPAPAYPPADLITADSGCRNPKSLVLIPTGLMYQSDKGIYLLGRDLSTTYIGAGVEAYNSANVTSALQVPSTTQVRFTLDSGVCLVYDWLVDQWATFTNVAAADAAVFNGLFTYCQAAGAVFTETPGSFTDAGNPIKLRLTTSWLSFAGIQGLQRIWEMLVLGEYRSAHSLRVSVAFDFDPTPHEVVAVNAATLLGQLTYGVATPYGSGTYGGAFPLYQFRVKMLQERCQAVQITLEDTQTAPYGEGMALSVISFVAGVVGTAKKVPASRTFGV